MTYALLIYRSVFEPMPELELKAALAGHRSLQAEASAGGQLHAVAQLDGSRRAFTVRKRDGAHEVTDGPYVETKEWLVGFYLVDCADDEEAMARARVICADGAHAIEVRPVVWRWKP